MPKGTVKWFSDAKGYGFIESTEVNTDIFVHYSSLNQEGFRTLAKGDMVEFELTTGEKGPKAESVSRIAQA